MCCYVFTGYGNLRGLHKILKKGNTWEKLHERYLQQLQQISVVQGLVLTTTTVFITTNPPHENDIEYISSASYACLTESLVFSLFGLLFQASTSGFVFQKCNTAGV
ncbi:hypothetical protein BDR07DRAFT_399248 [Suillus spraguei]|nr:hypothetical protein BDR07DRAFT_399248 [Suillus spraguei]